MKGDSCEKNRGLKFMIFRLIGLTYRSEWSFQQHRFLIAGGTKAHKITFHIPATPTKNAKTAEVVVQEQAAPPVPELDPLQVCH